LGAWKSYGGAERNSLYYIWAFLDILRHILPAPDQFQRAPDHSREKTKVPLMNIKLGLSEKL